MKKERIAIATIETDAGQMTIFYNGINEEMTAEGENELVEEIGYRPKSLKDGVDTVCFMYDWSGWGLELLEGSGR